MKFLLYFLVMFFSSKLNAQQVLTIEPHHFVNDTLIIRYDTTVSNGVVIYLSDLENLEIRVKKGCTKTIISNLGWIVDSFIFIKEDDELVEIDDNLVIKFIPIIKQ